VEISQKQQFKSAIKNGDEELFSKLLPQLTITKKGYKTILKNNMKWQHDFILKALFKKKYLKHTIYIQELFFFAIKFNYESGVLYALKKGADPNGVYKGYNPLLYACLKGNKSIIKLLLEHGSNPNPPKFKNLTPKLKAVQILDMELVELLQKHGAILNQEEFEVGIVTAVKHQRFDLVDHFLLMGARIQNSTYMSLYFSNPTSIPFILRRDFSFNLCYQIKDHCFIQAARFGRLQTIKEYMKYGRHRTPEQELKKTLSAALIAAAGYGREAVVTYLLNQGADINYILNNQTAYDAALKANYTKVAHLLHKRGGRSFITVLKNNTSKGG
jgi:ankyrin repeat protein